MYARIDYSRSPLGRRITERMSAGRWRLSPAIVPELVSWMRMIGNRYIKMLEGIEAASRTKGDAFLNAVRQSTGQRIAMIQDLINLTVDQWAMYDHNIAWSQTCSELGITDMDTDPNLFDDHPLHEEGSGI